ncbi:BatD family protein [Labilibaculum sp. DW002]|jgi:oxygen tolerance protein BatD|uniref:BatD family protein n=1 Tax=Paralabilibaculum antarcticum TaxID=2912572 RepID=A0ABT5VRY0_9BACT|nr:BatD family protein [Labilibaculum sp. DW002]MDE5417268.1 BatD family protein [Labilibaculum sp. DW002]
MKKIFLSLLTLILISTSVFADGIKFTASAPNVVELGEQFRLTYSLNSKGKNIQLPALDGFRVLMGPSTSSNMSTQIINGKVTSSSSYSYTYVLLAEKEGKFNIKPASISVKGDKVSSNTLTIEVVKVNKTQQGSGNNQSKNAAASQKITQENLFVKVHLDRKSVYMGEHIVATIKVYTRLTIAGFGDSKFPSFDGFLSQEVPTPGQISLQRENVNGTIYNTGIIRKLILFPQHTGEITIDPFELECIVRQQRANKRSGFFDDFFDNYQDLRVPRKSKPIKIRVKDFPKSKPASFDGAVGKFNLTTTIDKDSVKANDAITMRVKVSGNGNLKLIKPLEFNFPADFEVYDPKTTQNLKSSEKGMSGSTTFEYLIIPRHGGEYEIPSVDFSFFDPKARIFRTRSTPKFNIKVAKGDGDASGTVISSFSKEKVKFIGKDIRFIKTNEFESQLKGEVFFGTTNFYLGYLIPFVLFILAFVFNRKRIKENADTIGQKNKRANRVAMKRLKAASASLKAKQKEQFYDEILKAIWGYTSDKLSLPLENLNKENISEILLDKGVEVELKDEFLSILDTCEFARYSPSAGSSEMDELYQTSMDTITKLEKNIK